MEQEVVEEEDADSLGEINDVRTERIPSPLKGHTPMPRQAPIAKTIQQEDGTPSSSVHQEIKSCSDRTAAEQEKGKLSSPIGSVVSKGVRGVQENPGNHNPEWCLEEYALFTFRDATQAEVNDISMTSQRNEVKCVPHLCSRY